MARLTPQQRDALGVARANAFDQSSAGPLLDWFRSIGGAGNAPKWARDQISEDTDELARRGAAGIAGNPQAEEEELYPSAGPVGPIVGPAIGEEPPESEYIQGEQTNLLNAEDYSDELDYHLELIDSILSTWEEEHYTPPREILQVDVGYRVTQDYLYTLVSWIDTNGRGQYRTIRTERPY
jgi:hypothetical protein